MPTQTSPDLPSTGEGLSAGGRAPEVRPKWWRRRYLPVVFPRPRDHAVLLYWPSDTGLQSANLDDDLDSYFAGKQKKGEKEADGKEAAAEDAK